MSIDTYVVRAVQGIRSFFNTSSRTRLCVCGRCWRPRYMKWSTVSILSAPVSPREVHTFLPVKIIYSSNDKLHTYLNNFITLLNYYSNVSDCLFGLILPKLLILEVVQDGVARSPNITLRTCLLCSN